MSDTFWMALFASIPATIVALTSLVVAVLTFLRQWIDSRRIDKQADQIDLICRNGFGPPANG